MIEELEEIVCISELTEADKDVANAPVFTA